MKYYALKFKKKPYTGASKYATLMVVSIVDSETEFHISTSKAYTLLTFTSRAKAQKVCDNTTSWYNSDEEHPINDHVGELEVVEFQLP